MPMKINRFTSYAWGVLGLNLFVILWGAFVRASGSGAGCGSHWPSCNGEVIPWSAQTETLIEFTHRVTSGLALLLVIGMLVWAVRAYPARHRVRWGATLSLAFIIIESLLGAGLVLFELVGENDSLARAVAMAIHLVNTFLLLSVITLTAWWASGGPELGWRGPGWLGWAFWLGFGAILVLAASGGVTALGDTLFPATSLAEGLQQKFSPTAHVLVRLRLYHPILAISIGLYLIGLSILYNIVHPSLTARRMAAALGGLYLAQLLVGAFNVLLLAPIWMQLVHLLISDLILIAYVIFMAFAFAQPLPKRKTQAQPLPQAAR